MVNDLIEAVALLSNPSSGIKGTVVFKEDSGANNKNDTVIIKIEISGLEPNSSHGIHIHTAGDLRQGCKSLCSHWNPYHAVHGGLTDPKKFRHAGDLGNAVTDSSGKVNLTLKDKLIKLRGKYSVVGRSVVLHEKEDDLGLGGDEESLKTGNSGARIACGVIGYSEKMCK